MARKKNTPVVETPVEETPVVETVEAREPRVVDISMGFKFEVTISPDAEEYAITKIADLKAKLREIVEGELRGCLDYSEHKVENGALFDFKVKSSWY